MRGQVTVHMEAPPERVWDLISDVTRMGEWSPETVRGEWTQGATGPAVGARFVGHNKKGPARWATTCEVVAADPGREFTFRVIGSNTVWGYRMAPSDGGSDVTEFWEAIGPDGVGGAIYRGLVVRFIYPVLGREGQIRRGAAQTLARLKAAAERQPV
ncbi:MAG: SRPBCC family protein [Chloroflexota bacterium]